MQSDQDGPPKETARASFIIGLAALLESYRATLSYDRDDDGIVVSFGDTEVFRGWLYSMEGIQRLRSSVDAAMPKLPEHADLDARRLLARLIAYLPLIGRADLAPTIEPNELGEGAWEFTIGKTGISVESGYVIERTAFVGDTNVSRKLASGFRAVTWKTSLGTRNTPPDAWDVTERESLRIEDVLAAVGSLLARDAVDRLPALPPELAYPNHAEHEL